MTKGTITVGMICLFAFYIVAFGSLYYADRTDPFRVNDAYGSVHGIVMPPYRG